jgi:hypothetical protein
MKDSHKRFSARPPMDSKKDLFPIVPILINIITIVVLSLAYFYVVNGNLFPDYQLYVYWAVNIIISYNVLVGSAKSFVMSVVATLAGIAALVGLYNYNIDILTLAQSWQIFALGIAGLLISSSTRL